MKNEQKEIIETYWNVNVNHHRYVYQVPAGNNRNILECKLKRVAKSLNTISEIIETYWNVNLARKLCKTSSSLEIIETYWNVNEIVFVFSSIHGTRNNRNILECK